MALPQFPYTGYSAYGGAPRGHAMATVRRFYIVLRSEHELYQVYLFGIFLWRDQTRAA
jgi:hypothetical protein